MDAPPLLVHAAMVRPAERDQIARIGRAAVVPVEDVVPVSPQM